MNQGSDIYGFCKRKVRLEKDKSYAMSIWGRIDATLSARGGSMRAYVYKESSNGTWTYSQYVDLTSTADSKAETKWTHAGATGEYQFAVYPYPHKEDGGGKCFLQCAQIEKIEDVANGYGTAWSANKDDAVALGNVLSDIRSNTWIFGDGVAVADDKAEIDGRLLDVIAGASSSSADLDVVDSGKVLTLGRGSVYTLSFWAQGSGSFNTYLYNGSNSGCSWAVRDDGNWSVDGNGAVAPDRTLTDEWTRYSVTFSVDTDGKVGVIPVQLRKNGRIAIAGLKLEPYGRATEYTDRDVTVEELKATGIDIVERLVRVTADKFQIVNNRGDETFAVDADGMVTMNHVALGGMINKQGVDVDGPTVFNTLFNSEKDVLDICCYAVPKFNNMYGIYYITAATGKNTDGKTPVRIHMPSAYVYQDGDGYYVSGDVYDESDRVNVKLLRSIRAMTGNTVMIYNDSSEDIQIEGKSCYFVDEWKPLSAIGEKSAASVRKAPSGGLVTPDTNVGDMSNTIDKPLVNDTDGGVKPNQRYYGRRRDDLLVTLKGGEHRFVSMTCVCEVNIFGWENIYWLVNYGQGLSTT